MTVGTVPVVVASDDQADEPVDIDRWSRLAADVLADEGVEGELNLLFVDEVAMARLNEEHMGHEGPTDVLSFPIDGPDAGPDGLLGDVVVCAAVARRNAPDHAEADEAATMRAREVAHLERFGR